jgi:NAD(P)-dependent dehydrogenase (short-subunit alcohol dehydrogenase family)
MAVEPIIGGGRLTRGTLSGQVALVTGAGGGIGYETARALAWLGASVVVAEINRETGSWAAAEIIREMGPGTAVFIHADIGDEESVAQLAQDVLKEYGRVDILLNNATVTPMGAIIDCPVTDWDLSYRVNLRGPVLLCREFLPGMLERNYGVIICVSSVGEAYMGAYECFKAAQIHLARTLEAELEGTGVIAFTIGPGLVRTPGALAGIAKLAPLYGKTVEEFFALSKDHIISAEAAGSGFAAAVALASQFRGLEIDSRTALAAAGIMLPEEEKTSQGEALSEGKSLRLLEISRRVRETIREQAEGWKERPLFERQWMFRNFKKTAGLSVEQWLELLAKLEQLLEQENQAEAVALRIPAHKLTQFYANMQQLARGYIRDPAELEKNLAIVRGWQEEAAELAALLE